MNPASYNKANFGTSRAPISFSHSSHSRTSSQHFTRGNVKMQATASSTSLNEESPDKKEEASSSALATAGDPNSNSLTDAKPTKYAWSVLWTIFAVRAIHQLHRQIIGYAYGYQGLGEKFSPFYMISLEYPQMSLYYGLIASFVFSSSYSTLGVWAGILSGKMNRKVLLGLACIGWSATTFGAGLVPSFGFFILMRFMLGGFESACNPASYALIADYFSPKYRSTANAIETSGSYVGDGIASIGVILIKKYGWRNMYMIMGGLGMALGAFVLAFIKEPGRGVFDF